ncbi:Photosystem I assembly protein Ycf3 [Bienertia sinuspersici]
MEILLIRPFQLWQIFYYESFRQPQEKRRHLLIIEMGDSEIAEAWFDQAAEYWKQAITLTPGNYIEAHNWLKITGRFE